MRLLHPSCQASRSVGRDRVARLSATVAAVLVAAVCLLAPGRAAALGAVVVNSNDDIPGVAIPLSPVVGDLGFSVDEDDVYAIVIQSGQTLSVKLEAHYYPGSDFDVYLYAPSAVTVKDHEIPVAGSRTATYPEEFSYTATDTGTYYVDVHAVAGYAFYTLEWSLSAVHLEETVTAPATVYRPIAPSVMFRDRSATIRGYVAPAHDTGTYLVKLKFYRKNSSGAYVYHHSVRARRYDYSATQSAYRASVSLSHRGRWRVRAYHACEQHVGRHSSYDYITVK